MRTSFLALFVVLSAANALFGRQAADNELGGDWALCSLRNDYQETETESARTGPWQMSLRTPGGGFSFVAEGGLGEAIPFTAVLRSEGDAWKRLPEKAVFAVELTVAADGCKPIRRRVHLVSDGWIAAGPGARCECRYGIPLRMLKSAWSAIPDRVRLAVTITDGVVSQPLSIEASVNLKAVPLHQATFEQRFYSIYEGMTKDEVIHLLGEPGKVEKVDWRGSGREAEKLEYIDHAPGYPQRYYLFFDSIKGCISHLPDLC